MRGRHLAWLGLGANLGDPPAQLGLALSRLDSGREVGAVGVSRLWRGPYQGPRGPQPDYYNLCARVETDLDARGVLELAQRLEREAGRPPGGHQEPRVLDIDLLLFDTLCLEEPGLVLPHPRMRERRFVLEPLADLDPELALPPDGVCVGELLRRPQILAQQLEVVPAPGDPGLCGYGSGK